VNTQTNAATPKKKKPLLMTGRELMALTVAPQEWIVDGLLRIGRKRISLLAGKPESGKSCIGRQLTVAVVKGEPFFGRQTVRGSVLLWQTEECPEDVRKKRGYYQRLFERGMALCNRQKLGRVESFVTSYAFHRVLLTTFLLSFLVSVGIEGLLSLQKVQLQVDKLGALHFLIGATGIGTTIEFFRARKRAYYYAREVLWMTADHIRASTNLPEKQTSK